MFANTIGSAANITLALENDDYRFFYAERNTTSNDPRTIFPLVSHGDWLMALADERWGKGEAFFYEFMINVAKAPVEWDATAIEPNDSFDEAMEMTEGEVIFGVVEDDHDNFFFTVPPAVGELEVTVTVSGWDAGSPMQPWLIRSEAREELVFVPPEETGDTGYFETDIEYVEVKKNHGGVVTNPHAIISVVSEPGEVLYYTVRDFRDYNGLAYWYLISVETNPPALDPVDTAGDTGLAKKHSVDTDAGG